MSFSFLRAEGSLPRGHLLALSLRSMHSVYHMRNPPGFSQDVVWNYPTISLWEYHGLDKMEQRRETISLASLLDTARCTLKGMRALLQAEVLQNGNIT